MLERTAAVWMRPGLCPPVPTSPHSLSLSICWSVGLSVCQLLVGLLLSVFQSVSLCQFVICSIHSVSIALMHSVMLHTSCRLFSPLCLSIIPLFFFSSILSLPPLFPLFALSSCPTPPLPASHSSSAPSQTAISQLCLVTGKAGLVWERVLCCARHVPVVSSIVHVCMGVYVLVLFFFLDVCFHVYPLCWHVQRKHTCRG